MLTFAQNSLKTEFQIELSKLISIEFENISKFVETQADYIYVSRRKFNSVLIEFFSILKVYPKYANDLLYLKSYTESQTEFELELLKKDEFLFNIYLICYIKIMIETKEQIWKYTNLYGSDKSQIRREF